AENGRWAVLSFRQTVDAVIEENVIDIQVATQHVHEMIAANGQGIAVSRDHPNAEFRIRGFYSGGDCRRASVDAVKAVSVHVVRKARGTADTGNKNHLFARNAEVGHYFLHVIENRVVAAARAPAHFL